MKYRKLLILLSSYPKLPKLSIHVMSTPNSGVVTLQVKLNGSASTAISEVLVTVTIGAVSEK